MLNRLVTTRLEKWDQFEIAIFLVDFDYHQELTAPIKSSELTRLTGLLWINWNDLWVCSRSGGAPIQSTSRRGHLLGGTDPNWRELLQIHFNSTFNPTFNTDSSSGWIIIITAYAGADVVAVHKGRSFGSRMNSGEQGQRCRFARTAVAVKRRDLALVRVQIDVTDLPLVARSCIADVVVVVVVVVLYSHSNDIHRLNETNEFKLI